MKIARGSVVVIIALQNYCVPNILVTKYQTAARFHNLFSTQGFGTYWQDMPYVNNCMPNMFATSGCQTRFTKHDLTAAPTII
jgi:hypothetical protein